MIRLIVGRIQALLGALANSVGEPAEALNYLNSALSFEPYNSQSEIANVSCNIGDAHLKKAEFKLAHAAFRRSLHLAERVGDIPLMSVDFRNMGVLCARSGDLREAEDLFKQSLVFAERINDQIYVSV